MAESEKMMDSLNKSPEMQAFFEQMEAMEAQNQQTRQEQQESSDRASAGNAKASAKLSLAGETYNYAIDRERSRIDYDEGVWLALRQGGLPEIVFEFPTLERYSAIRQYNFELPAFNQVDGRQPIVFHFITGEGTYEFEGTMEASLIHGVVSCDFDGTGVSPSGEQVPVSGKFKVPINSP